MQIEKVSYDVNWRAFKRGTSIFIPCLDPARAKQELAVVLERLRIKTVTKVVIQDGIRGLRIWRM
jgi:hypothetical protein